MPIGKEFSLLKPMLFLLVDQSTRHVSFPVLVIVDLFYNK